MAGKRAVIPQELKDRLLNDPSLPVVIPFKNNVNIYINLYNEYRDFKDICPLMKSVSDEGLGIGSKEYATDDDVKDKLRQGTTFILRDNDENGNLIGVNILMPCSLTKSERPLYTGSNVAVHPKYRSQGIGEFVLVVLQYIASGQGLKPILGRHTITARSNIPARSGGAVYLGIIPKSIRIKKPNVVADDIIVFYGDHWPRKKEETVDGITNSEEVKIPPLEPDISFQTINSPLPVMLQTREVYLRKGEKFSIKEPSSAEYSLVETMVRNSAESGKMIGIDEFTETGLWNRKFLRKTYILGAYNNQNKLAGVALFGPSSITRTDSIIMSGYIILDQDHQFLGLESILVEAVINISKELDFEGLLLDVYQTELKFIGLLMDMGFKVTGSLPKCGFVKGKGNVDSILLYKEFIVGSCKL